MNWVHNAYSISTFLNLLQEVVDYDDENILKYIVLTPSMDEARAYEIDKESF
jgi:hypothetical protein